MSVSPRNSHGLVILLHICRGKEIHLNGLRSVQLVCTDAYKEGLGRVMMYDR